MRIKVALTLLIALGFVLTLSAQNEEAESTSPFSTGVDLYSGYIWRGTRIGNSPAVQPYVEFAKGGLSIGAWGSFDFADYAETDLYISYEFPFGLSLGVTDYYLCDLQYFDYSISSGSHAFDFSAGFEIKGLSLSANCIINEAGSIGSEGRDIYLEAGYSFPHVKLFLGAGNGWYTSDSNFDICNLGIGTEKEIRVTDTFSIPVSGQIILNPDTESLYITVGLSL